MVSGSGHGGLGTERLDKINEFLYSFTDKRSKNPGSPVRFGRRSPCQRGSISSCTHAACFIPDLDRMGHQLRQCTGHRMSLCDRKLGTQAASRFYRIPSSKMKAMLVLSHAPKLPTVKSKRCILVYATTEPMEMLQ
jgi:hypothetical protein